MTRCGECDKPLGRRNASGFCRKHFATHEPTWRERRRETMRRKYAADPAALETHRALLYANMNKPEAIEKRRQHARDRKLSERGRAAQRSIPGFYSRKAYDAATRRLMRLGVPRDELDAYREIMRNRKVSSDEARAMVIESHEIKMARFRREIMEARG